MTQANNVAIESSQINSSGILQPGGGGLGNNTGSEFASGTILTFGQTAAPTGWTKITTNDNAALRVVSGSVSSGGSVAFTTAFASQTPSGSVSTSVTGVSGSVSTSTSIGTTYLNDPYYMPSHQHYLGVYLANPPGGGAGANYATTYYPGSFGLSQNTDAQGGNGGHNHSASSSSSFSFSSGSASSSFSGNAINLAVKYVDCIMASKN